MRLRPTEYRMEESSPFENFIIGTHTHTHAHTHTHTHAHTHIYISMKSMKRYSIFTVILGICID